jgi:hypothetical protein
MPENLSQFGVFGNSRHGKHGSHVENGAPGFRTGWTTDIVPVNPASSGEYRFKPVPSGESRLRSKGHRQPVPRTSFCDTISFRFVMRIATGIARMTR